MLTSQSGFTLFAQKTAMIALIALSAWGSLAISVSTTQAIGSLIVHLMGIGLVAFARFPVESESRRVRRNQIKRAYRQSPILPGERKLA